MNSYVLAKLETTNQLQLEELGFVFRSFQQAPGATQAKSSRQAEQVLSNQYSALSDDEMKSS